MMPARRLVLAATLALLGACSRNYRPTLAAYADRARAEYEAAMEVFEGGDPQDAADRFQRVRREYGLSRWAWLSELRIADTDYRQEHYTAAMQGYRAWIRYHPTQPEVDYAHFMISKCHFGEIPVDWFIAPPVWERDLLPAKDAEGSLVQFLDDFPTSEHAVEARTMLHRVREMLARAEINIGEYHLSRGGHEAAIARYEVVLRDYRDSLYAPDALVHIGEANLLLDRKPAAIQAFRRVIAEYPSSGLVESARRYLAFLHAAVVDPADATAAPGTAPATAPAAAPSTATP